MDKVMVIALVILVIASFFIFKFSPHKITVTSDVLEETLRPISEMNTAAFEYTGKDTRRDTRTGLGILIPGTTNSVTISYSGVITVGYDVSAMKETADTEEKIIYVYLPESKVTHNYIDTENLELESNNNILNPIDVEDLFEYLKEIQAKELDRAVEDGMYDTAREQIESLITGLLSVFDDYTVQFVSEAEFAALDAVETADTDVSEATDASDIPDDSEITDAPETTVAPEVEQTEKPAA